MSNQKFTDAYLRYLKSPKWRDRSRACILRAFGKCQKCGTRKAVQAHHLTYKRLFQELPEDLMAVCDSCHREIHHRPPKPKHSPNSPNYISRKERRQKRAEQHRLLQEQQQIYDEAKLEYLLDRQLKQFEMEVGVRL